MFHTRNTLHRRAYQHKTSNVVELMLVQTWCGILDVIIIDQLYLYSIVLAWDYIESVLNSDHFYTKFHAIPLNNYNNSSIIRTGYHRILFILGNSSIVYLPNITYLWYIRITEALVAANEHFLIKGKDGYVPILLMIITLIIIV